MEIVIIVKLDDNDAKFVCNEIAECIKDLIYDEQETYPEIGDVTYEIKE
jgi:hypothetical protein